MTSKAKSSFVSYQARLDSFAVKKARRPSARSKKPTQNAWPLTYPSAHDLAFAGFVWKPTSASPDNVQCFSCSCQLDGWEESDVPAHEHLTHSPNCGFAINICIRMRQSDPDRIEKDPFSAEIRGARVATFADHWPLDSAAGYPSVDQVVDAGWYYDPSPDAPDSVSCPYCSLSLSDWEPDDNPLDEHYKRNADCHFFTLKKLYHPVDIPWMKSNKRKSQTNDLHASIQSSTPPTKPKAAKGHRGTKRKSDSIDAELELLLRQQAELESEEPSEPSEVRSIKRTRLSNHDEPSEPSMPSIPSLPGSAIGSSTPLHRTIPDNSEAMTPPRQKSPIKVWEPIDIDAFFSEQKDNELLGVIAGVLVDTSLDKENFPNLMKEVDGDATKLVHEVMSRLTDEERGMSVEQWVLYNAQRGEQKLRTECEKLIAAFEEKGKMALATLRAVHIAG
ncbi:inhibitor of apoptosis repeat-containing protein [Amniculicola lignicola CBS 123094]|uniref:Inhibitor of apoptosis repeat-containing protein n=1 Tax=Amniculicola lignicola CBS 123094 TaxID=1392246 RepID=A0A6A5WSE3_9PLEO|nr:inhibitor of apoptosis repeat-containing protein [Amniculicola lignicola CBS 123094]